MPTSAFFKLPTLKGGYRADSWMGRHTSLTKPVWSGGFPLEIDPLNRDQTQPRQNYGDIRSPIIGCSFGPSWGYRQKGDLPTGFTDFHQSGGTAQAYVLAMYTGIYEILAKSDHATGYYLGEHMKVVTDSQTIEGVASTTVPTVEPVNEWVGGSGWGIPQLGDSSNLTGSHVRAVNAVLIDFIGQSDKTVSANPGDEAYTDVVLMLQTPAINVPST